MVTIIIMGGKIAHELQSGYWERREAGSAFPSTPREGTGASTQRPHTHRS